VEFSGDSADAEERAKIEEEEKFFLETGLNF